MQRLIEEYGWRRDYGGYGFEYGALQVVLNNKGELEITSCDLYGSRVTLPFEELQAIYETAKQIKEEHELEERILCNKCANNCYYGFIACDNFMPRDSKLSK